MPVTNTNDSVSGASLPAGSVTADDQANPPASSAVAHLITATNRTIADAHEHGRKRPAFKDVLIARALFAVARRLARWAWRVAETGRRRVQ